ncbi:MAG: response regulator transcription factor [Anaerolineae bacterium]
MIVDDQETVGEGSAVFLEAFDDLELVGEAANGREAIYLYIKARPDMILMDLMMPEMDAEPWRAGARTSSITVCVALDEAGNGTMLRLC